MPFCGIIWQKIRNTGNWPRTLLVRVTGFIISLLIVLGSFSSVVTPQVRAFGSLRSTVKAALSELFQGPVDVGSAEFVGLSRVSARNIVVKDPKDEKSVILRMDELVLGYNLLNLVIHITNMDKAVTEVVLKKPRLWIKMEPDGSWNISRLFRTGSDVGPASDLQLCLEKGEVYLAGANLGVGDLTVGLDGKLGVSDTGLRLDRATIRLFGQELTAGGTLANGNLDVWMKAVNLDLQDITEHFPQTRDMVIRGKASMEIRAAGNLTHPIVTGRVYTGPGSIEFPAHDNASYSIDGLDAFFRYTEQKLEITKLIVAQGLGRVQARGSIDADGDMNFKVVTRALDLTRNLHFLKNYGIAGAADFAGSLSGTILQPQFSGELAMKDGLFWGRPFDELAGHVTMDLNALHLSGFMIRSGHSMYALGGTIQLAKTPRIDLILQSSGGRAEEILAALGIPGELTARLDGSLEFKGVPGAITTRGHIHLTNGRFQEQVFDSAAGEFVITPTKIIVSKGTASLDGGTVFFQGETQGQGPLVLDVKVQQFPIEKLVLLRGLDKPVEGRLSFTGSALIAGSLQEPWARVRVAMEEPAEKVKGVEVDVSLEGRRVVVNNVVVPGRSEQRIQ